MSRRASILDELPYPRFDRTGAGPFGYRVDGACGRKGSYASGERYSVDPTADGHVIGFPSVQNVERARALLAYLNGPRRVVLSVAHLGPMSYDDRDIGEYRMTVHDGPDVEDWRGWRDWIANCAHTWLANHPNSGDRLHFALADTECANLNGIAGFRCLGSVSLYRDSGDQWQRC
jgi:hypothetical protein